MSLDRAAAGLGLGLAAALGAGMIAGVFGGPMPPAAIEIRVHFSRFEPASVSVPAGRPVTFVLSNTDPIDHEWIVGDEATHFATGPARSRSTTPARRRSRCRR